jgi:hypothetical protein
VTRRLRRAALLALLAAPLLLAGCSDDSSPYDDPDVAASAPLPDVTLPPGTLRDLAPKPDEVPAGMVPVVLGSGPRTLDEVAGYSGAGAVKAQAATSLRAHGFQDAYVAQYANQSTGQVLSVVVTRFATVAGAAADFSEDEKSTSGEPVPTEQLGDSSSVTKQTVSGSSPAELVLVRIVRGVNTWVIAYQASPTASADVPVTLAKALLARTTD